MKQPGLTWLLERRDPPIRFHALRDILGRRLEDRDVREARNSIKDYAPAGKILKARTREGYWPPRDTCYLPKWTASVWPLMLLGELGFPADENVKKACEHFLDLHQKENGAFACPSRLEEPGKRWDEPCLTGNMVRTLLVFGYGEDSRVKGAIDWLPEQQLEDGGWNCDFPEKNVKHSSFMSSIEPLWAYSEIPRARWTRSMKKSAERGAEFLLMHRVYKSDHHHWRHSLPFSTSFHFPMYYYYDALHGLRVLTKLGYGDDERVRDAVHLILSKRTPDGKWLLEGDWSREPEAKENKRRAIVELETLWEPSKWVTLNCFRALVSTGDIDVSRK